MSQFIKFYFTSSMFTMFRTLIHPSSGTCDFSIVSHTNQCGDTIEKSQAPDDGCINPLTPNDYYSGHTAPLTSKRCIVYIYSTNTCTEYFKHGIYCPFFSLQNAVCFIILTY